LKYHAISSLYNRRGKSGYKRNKENLFFKAQYCLLLNIHCTDLQFSEGALIIFSRRMGCTASSQEITTIKKLPKGDGTFGRDKNLNRSDFILSKLSFETAIRKSGSINGQQFCVEECSDSSILLLDHIGTLTCDDLKACTVITGPIESSAFIRGSDSCIIVVACQQLRLRDCRNLRVFLYSLTRPIIENCFNIAFSCYDFDYFGLEANIKSSMLGIWTNNWEDVYDFTPNPAVSSYRIMPPSVSSKKLLKPDVVKALSDEGLVLAPNQEGTTNFPFIKCCGVQHEIKGEGNSALLCLPYNDENDSKVRDVINKWINEKSTQKFIVRTALKFLSETQLQTLCETKAAILSPRSAIARTLIKLTTGQ
jgi:hypothetical protein